jgi:hypothetical protein
MQARCRQFDSKWEGEEWVRFSTHRPLKSSVYVLRDTLPIKDVAALALYRIFSDIVAQPAHGGFLFAVSEEPGIFLAADDKVWVTRHLSHAGQPFNKGSNKKVVYSTET